MDTACDCIQCEYLGAKAAEILKANSNGRILMCSTQGIYFEFGDELVMLCDCEKGRVSFAVELRDFQKYFPKNRDLEGERVKLQGEKLSFCGRSILLPRERELSGKPVLPLLQLIEKEAPMVELVRTANKSFLPLLLPYRSELISGTLPEMTVNLGNIYAQKAAKNVAELFSALRQNDCAEAAFSMLKMLGLGPGLTPSTDDWTVGFLYTVRAFLNEPAIDEICSAVKENAHEYTSRISCAYLTNACTGGEFEMLEELLGTGEDAAAERLLTVGSSSGSDMLCGYLFGLSYLKETLI